MMTIFYIKIKKKFTKVESLLLFIISLLNYFANFLLITILPLPFEIGFSIFV